DAQVVGFADEEIANRTTFCGAVTPVARAGSSATRWIYEVVPPEQGADHEDDREDPRRRPPPPRPRRRRWRLHARAGTSGRVSAAAHALAPRAGERRARRAHR